MAIFDATVFVALELTIKISIMNSGTPIRVRYLLQFRRHVA